MFWLGCRIWARSGHRLGAVAGLVIGTALVFGVLTANSSALRDLDEAVQAGELPEVTVTPLSASRDAEAEVVGRLSDLPAAVELIPVTARPALAASPAGRADLLAVGMDPDQLARSYPHRVEEGRLPRPGSDEVVIAGAAARPLAVRVGERFFLAGRVVTVVGILAPEGIGLLNDELVVLGDRPVVALDGGQPVLSRVDVDLPDGTDAGAWVATAEEHLAGLAAVEMAETPNSGFLTFLQSIRLLLGVLALVALLASALLVFLTRSTALARRHGDIVLLRAVGASVPQVWRSILGEAAALGLVALVAGLPLGFAAAAGIQALIGAITDLPGGLVPVLSAPNLAIAAVLGALTPLLASIGPAWRASRVAPAEGLRPAASRPPRSVRLLVAGGALIAAGVVVADRSTDQAGLAAAVVAVLLGVGVALPGAVPAAARLVRALTRLVRADTAELAVLHLVKERSRTSFALALVALVLVAALVIEVVRGSIGQSLDEVMTAQFGADVHLTAQSTFPPSFTERVRARPDLAAVTALRFGQVAVVAPARQTTNLVAVDESYFDVTGYALVAGDAGALPEAITSGRGALLPQPLSRTLGVGVGDLVVLAGRSRLVPVRVAGIFATLGEIPEVGVVVGRALGEQAFGLVDDGLIYGNVAEGHDPAAVARALRDELEGTAAVSIRTAATDRAFAEAQLRQYIAVFQVLLVLVAVIGALGVASTLAVTVQERRREIGLLRALGAEARRIRRLSFAEALVLMAVATAAAVPTAMLLGRLMVRVVADLLGFTLLFTFPWAALPVVGVVAVVLGVVAAGRPAATAARLDPVVALQAE